MSVETAHPRRVAHLDMDAFYASVELLRYPELADLPVVIGGHGHKPVDGQFMKLADYKGRGVITTATYAARAFGVHSAMGMMKAARLCPQAILLPVDFEAYRHYSRLFKSVIREHAERIEDRGIDEVYIDFTAVELAQREGDEAFARRIQAAIAARTGLSCSIGVAPNKLLAKMASELHKPRGICVIGAADVPERIWPLACRKIHGVGPKASARLEELGIRTIGELARQPRAWLMAHFGAGYGVWLHEAAHGRDQRPVQTRQEPVSMSRKTTFERDLHAVRDRSELGAIFTELCEEVAADLQRKGYVGRTVGIKLRYADFRSVTRDHTVAEYTADAATIRRIAGLCLKRVPLQQSLRLLGVRVGKLERRADLERGADPNGQLPFA
ncbi:MAG: DNA polymerase IV [Steroidobacteraceae bacterium]